MQITIPGTSSYFETERLTWTMNYPVIGTKQYTEVGLHFHIDPQDANTVETVISAAVGAQTAGLNGVLGAIVGIASDIVQHLATNADGSIDFHIAPDGFAVGNLPSGDPNVWFFPNWGPVRAALELIQSVPVGPPFTESLPEEAKSDPAGISGHWVKAEPAPVRS
jgi:hypothetical protein